MITGLILLIIFFLFLNAFFAGSEAALTSLNKIRLRHLVESKDKRAVMLNDFLKEEGDFLGTTLVGTNISVIICSALATYLFSFWLGRNAAIVSTIVMTSVILVFGEVIPKTIFRQSSNAISLRIILPLKFMFRALYPMIFFVTAITRFLLKPLKIQKIKESKPFLTKKDIEMVLKTSRKKGSVGPDEETLIQRIFKLGITTVDKIMVPLNQAALINVEGSIENLKTIASRTRFSRFPVYENQNNNIIGLINVYDILFFTHREKPALRGYVQSPFFINEKERIDRVLSELRKKKKSMAIVINKEGKSIGLITIEDLLEEIVGEIGG
ncbi:MAG: HlyC/CorC family transporter [Candidatus Omnitrophica bacterium]|nr:HlyC/CorC family transporter [Candidatus Omnitrophota bacterium]